MHCIVVLWLGFVCIVHVCICVHCVHVCACVYAHVHVCVLCSCLCVNMRSGVDVQKPRSATGGCDVQRRGWGGGGGGGYLCSCTLVIHLNAGCLYFHKWTLVHRKCVRQHLPWGMNYVMPVCQQRHRLYASRNSCWRLLRSCRIWIG